MSTPIVVRFENNYSGLVVTGVTGEYSENPPPVSNSQFLVDRNEVVEVRVHWDTSGSNPIALHALDLIADWEGEAVLHAISPSAVTTAAVGTPTAFVAGAASMAFTFAANTLQSGIYRLYVRVSLRDKPALGVHYLPVNMVGESNPILVFDAI